LSVEKRRKGRKRERKGKREIVEERGKGKGREDDGKARKGGNSLAQDWDTSSQT
jgi:hypothetical protein